MSGAGFYLFLQGNKFGAVKTDTTERVLIVDEEETTDWINPAHYRRGPTVNGKPVECIEIVRDIPDFRLANAMKYIWRVAFGGKLNNKEDILKAVWYLSDYVDFPPEERR